MSDLEKLPKALKRKLANHAQAMNKATRRQERQTENKKAKRGGKEKRVRHKTWAPANIDVATLTDPAAWADFNSWEENGFVGRERIMPVGEQERKRSLEKSLFQQQNASVDTEDNPAVIEEGASLAKTVEGRVIEVSTGLCRVRIERETLLCTIRQGLRTLETGFTNVVAVGDKVRVRELDAERGVIEQVLPRRTLLARPDVFYNHLRQIVVANADQLLIVAAWREPAIWFELIDRYLIAAERAQLPAVLCVNKLDLVDDRRACEAALQPYDELGVAVILTSAETGEGIETLRTRLAHRISVLAGLSGVGKSSLLSSVEPGLQLRVADVSDRKHEGRHTTTQAAWHALAVGGAVVDTPGIRDFGLAGMYRHELVAYFPEIAEQTADCRFRNCTHINEAGCAVLASVKRGKIAESRYHSYMCIYPTLA